MFFIVFTLFLENKKNQILSFITQIIQMFTYFQFCENKNKPVYKQYLIASYNFSIQERSNSYVEKYNVIETIPLSVGTGTSPWPYAFQPPQFSKTIDQDQVKHEIVDEKIINALKKNWMNYTCRCHYDDYNKCRVDQQCT